jgi:hypothetical protein
MADGPNGQLITCKYCLNENVKKCLKCQSTFCSLHAAVFSPNFCKDCFNNLTAVMSRFTRTTTEYDSVTDTVEKITSGCDRIQLDGPDWIFYSEWIDNLTDDDLATIYEFHYFVLKLIEHDNEVRKVKKARKLASQPTPIGVVTTKTSSVKREAKPKDMQKELEKLNLPEATIRAMLQAAGISYKENSQSA